MQIIQAEEFKEGATLSVWSKLKDSERKTILNKMDRTTEKLRNREQKKESNKDIADRLRQLVGG